MIRSITVGLLVAVATAGLGVLSAPAWAADPANEQARPAEGAETRLWWNDPAMVEKLGLSGDQREQMDLLFETYRSAQKSHSKTRAIRTAFYEALKQGDAERAPKELASWAEGEAGLIRALGELRIGVFSLLSEEQRKTFVSAYPRLLPQPWGPRASWEPRRQPKRPVGEKQQKKPAN
jgi:Spy/CpxP family protein refolding chaperone